MNVWTDIALGNLQRTRPAPVDYEEGEPWYVCTDCGENKPRSAYYIKTRRHDTDYRQGICKQCQGRRQKIERDAKKAAKPVKLSGAERFRQSMSVRPQTVRQIAELAGMHRRSAQKYLEAAIARGDVKFAGLLVAKSNPRIPTYALTHGPDGAGKE